MKRLELLDYARFFAAILVILCHYTFGGIFNGMITSISQIPSVIEITKYGYLGVELFFMISGYVIFFSARNRSASEFAVSRAVRLYPAYWFAILFTSFFTLLWGGELMTVSLGQIIANFSMLQTGFGFNHVDGVYWTLVYEITFYFAVFLLLFLGLQKQLNYFFIYWPALFLISLALGIDSIIYLGGYYYYFAAGALFAVLAEKFDLKVVLSLLVTYVLAINFSVGKRIPEVIGPGETNYSPLVIGIVISSFFLLMLWQNTKSAQSIKLPMSRLAGALTYPVYLIHAHFGYIIINKFATEENKFIVYGLTISTVFIIAFFINKIIETHLHSVWKALFEYTVGRPVDYIQAIPSKIRLAYNNRNN